jgi:dienelactone hydrolase
MRLSVARCLIRKPFTVLFTFFFVPLAFAQSEPQDVGAVLDEEILAPATALYQMKQYILSRVAPPPVAASAAEWSAQAQRLRQHLLNDVVFHGWPEAWVTAPPKFEEAGVIETGQGYRLRKLRYEIVPGFYSAAILYEPERLQGKVPGILNVNGHDYRWGKAAEYKQKRCINFAQHGILALNLEWFYCGELHQEGNQHWFGAHLDLVGASGLGLFYLEMRRGLDYLYHHPNVDQNRLGVTGLSGGGWQTIVLSSLDERVKVSVPVAGYSATSTKVEARKYGDLGDLEQNSTDFLDGVDYTHLTALRAPRPTLLINNAEDDCCFRGPLVKPLIYDGIKPFFKLYGKEDDFEYYENRDPGTHNYQLLSREQAYRFFSKQFSLPVIESETPAGQEIKSYDELVVGLPKDNLTILGLARKLASEITRPPIPSESGARSDWAVSERQKLARLVRYKPVHLSRVWTLANTKHRGVETKSYLFDMDNGLSVNGVWLKGIVTPKKTPIAIVINDGGKKAAREEVSDRVNRDEQVLAVDLTFVGDAWKGNEPYSYAQILDGLGDRPLGMQVAELVGIVRWSSAQGRSAIGLAAPTNAAADGQKVRLECTGMRSQVAGLVAAALEPGLFSEVRIDEGLSSLGFLLQGPVTFDQAPELFCLDLYKDFDLDRLAVLAAPARVVTQKFIETPPKRETQVDE